MQRIKCTQDQISKAIGPVLDIGRLVDHIILSTFFKRHVFECFDRVFTAWVNKKAEAACGCFYHPVGRVDLVFNSPWCLGADAAEAKAADDVVICPAC